LQEKALHFWNIYFHFFQQIFRYPFFSNSRISGKVSRHPIRSIPTFVSIYTLPKSILGTDIKFWPIFFCQYECRKNFQTGVDFFILGKQKDKISLKFGKHILKRAKENFNKLSGNLKEVEDQKEFFAKIRTPVQR